MMPARILALVCATLLGTACTTTPASRTAGVDADPDLAAAGGDAASAPTVAATAEEDPLVCKKVIQTGTRVAQRTCMRRSQMEAHQRDAHEMLGEVQRRGVHVNEREE